MVLQDDLRPHMAGSEADDCTKYEAFYPSTFHAPPICEPDIGQSTKQTQWELPIILEAHTGVDDCLRLPCR